jgi:hypothetical protein
MKIVRHDLWFVVNVVNISEQPPLLGGSGEFLNVNETNANCNHCIDLTNTFKMMYTCMMYLVNL